MNFRKKPVVIQAVLWTGSNVDEMVGFMLAQASLRRQDVPHNGGTMIGGGLIIETLEGDHLANPGDWIIKGVKGEFYPCKDEIFKMTYEPLGGVENGE